MKIIIIFGCDFNRMILAIVVRKVFFFSIYENRKSPAAFPLFSVCRYLPRDNVDDDDDAVLWTSAQRLIHRRESLLLCRKKFVILFLAIIFSQQPCTCTTSALSTPRTV